MVAEFAEEAGEESRQPSTVRECCNAWLDAKRRGVGPATLKCYQFAVHRFLA